MRVRDRYARCDRNVWFVVVGDVGAVLMVRSTTMRCRWQVRCVWFSACAWKTRKKNLNYARNAWRWEWILIEILPDVVVYVVVVVSIADTLAAAYKSIYFRFHDSWQELLLSFALIFVVRNLGCVKCSAVISCCVYWNFV